MRNVMFPLLSPKDLEYEVTARDGLIPIDIDVATNRLLWLDLEQYHCYQGFFQESLESWVSMRAPGPVGFTSSLDTLKSIRIPDNALAPTAFIFHGGRCGSTLLTQVLARSRRNMVFGEAAPHNQIWHRADLLHRSASRLTDAAEALYKNLFLTMGRRRLSSYHSHIVKFTSFNILRFNLIRAVFPEVPALFLFREPGAMLKSYRRAAPSWLGGEIPGLHPAFDSLPATPEAAVEVFFRAALSVRDPLFRCFDYDNLTAESLTPILALLRLEVTSTELKQMRDGFKWDSKSGRIPRPFEPRSGEEAIDRKSPTAPEALRQLYTRLTRAQPLVEHSI